MASQGKRNYAAAFPERRLQDFDNPGSHSAPAPLPPSQLFSVGLGVARLHPISWSPPPVPGQWEDEYDDELPDAPRALEEASRDTTFTTALRFAPAWLLAWLTPAARLWDRYAQFQVIRAVAVASDNGARKRVLLEVGKDKDATSPEPASPLLNSFTPGKLKDTICDEQEKAFFNASSAQLPATRRVASPTPARSPPPRRPYNMYQPTVGDLEDEGDCPSASSQPTPMPQLSPIAARLVPQHGPNRRVSSWSFAAFKPKRQSKKLERGKAAELAKQHADLELELAPKAFFNDNIQEVPVPENEEDGSMVVELDSVDEDEPKQKVEPEQMGEPSPAQSPLQQYQEPEEESGDEDFFAPGELDTKATLGHFVGRLSSPEISGPFLPELRDEDVEHITKAQADSVNGQNLIATIGTGKVSVHSMKTLLPRCFSGNPSAWLNDDIVNDFLALIVNDLKALVIETGDGLVPVVHAFPSQWYTSASQDITKVKRWAGRKNLGGANMLNARLLFFPICDGNHWRLIAIRPQQKKIEYLDSLNMPGQKYLSLARAYLRQELGDLFVDSNWTDVYGHSKKQVNGSDCGVFTCLNALALVRDTVPGRVDVDDGMRAARYHIAVALLTGTARRLLNTP